MISNNRINPNKLLTIKILNISKRNNLLDSCIKILKDKIEKRFYIERIAIRNNIHTLVDTYQLLHIDGSSSILFLNEEVCNQIIERISEGNLSFNSCFIFNENKELISNKLDWQQTEMEHSYTSTGIKFWRHQQQMLEFKKPYNGSPRSTVISTHISAEGRCNLRCPYCSVTYRDTHSRIALPVIKQYVEDLMTRGLQAVILTGGGEPTLYPHFNELVQWLKKEKDLSVALITNGTTHSRIKTETFGCFSWIRVSINVFPGWEDKISININDLNSDCIVGCSLVYTSEHEAIQDLETNRNNFFKRISKVADQCGAQYIRVLPNCLLEQKQLIQQHVILKTILNKIPDKRFFQQYKVHGAPNSNICHQSYFRPYLSEEPFLADGVPGTVFPCDSVVLNDSITRFANKYQLCKPENILDYIDNNIQAKFDPRIDCKGCVFTNNVNMLDNWKFKKVSRFLEFPNKLIHEEFV